LKFRLKMFEDLLQQSYTHFNKLGDHTMPVRAEKELALWCDIRVMEEDAYFGVYCRRWGIPLMDGAGRHGDFSKI